MSAKKIYIASSWQNPHHAEVVAALVAAGYEVFDYRRTVGFQWADTGSDMENLTASSFVLEVMKHPNVREALCINVQAIKDSDACVMLLESGDSSHFNLGLAAGMGKATCIYAPTMKRPELMYGACGGMAENIEGLVDMVGYLLSDEAPPKVSDSIQEKITTSAEDIAMHAVATGLIRGDAPDGKCWAVIVGTNGYGAAAAFDWSWVYDKMSQDGERGIVEYERMRAIMTDHREYIAVIPAEGLITIVIPFDLPADAKGQTVKGSIKTTAPIN